LKTKKKRIYFFQQISDDATLSRQHSVPSRRLRVRDLSLERHLSIKEQQYQSTTNNISNGRMKSTQPPTIPQEYYGTITNRFSPGINYYYQSCVK
jgi:hypothetical protein